MGLQETVTVVIWTDEPLLLLTNHFILSTQEKKKRKSIRSVISFTFLSSPSAGSVLEPIEGMSAPQYGFISSQEKNRPSVLNQSDESRHHTDEKKKKKRLPCVAWQTSRKCVKANYEAVHACLCTHTVAGFPGTCGEPTQTGREL